MVEIIRLKDNQIVKLQATIELQSQQIQQQTTAIEGMQKQLTELSTSVASLEQRSNEQSPQKIVPIFLATKNRFLKPAVEKVGKS